MPYKLDEIKKWGKGKDFRIFVAGNYRSSKALGLLDKITFWIKKFKKDLFYPVMMKDFMVPDPSNEEKWFKQFREENLPKIISKEELAVLSSEEKNEVASTIYLLQNCGYIFSELTTFGGGGAPAESLIAYRKGLKRYVFIKEGTQINPMFKIFVIGSNVHYYKNENHLKELIKSLLKAILAERK